jgi:hypothetical protein
MFRFLGFFDGFFGTQNKYIFTWLISARLVVSMGFKKSNKSCLVIGRK